MSGFSAGSCTLEGSLVWFLCWVWLWNRPGTAVHRLASNHDINPAFYFLSGLGFQQWCLRWGVSKSYSETLRMHLLGVWLFLLIVTAGLWPHTTCFCLLEILGKINGIIQGLLFFFLKLFPAIDHLATISRLHLNFLYLRSPELEPTNHLFKELFPLRFLIYKEFCS